MLLVVGNLIYPRGRMDIHKNARRTLHGREALVKTVVHQGSTLNSAAAEFRVGARALPPNGCAVIGGKALRESQFSSAPPVSAHCSRSDRTCGGPSSPALDQLPHCARNAVESGHGQAHLATPGNRPSSRPRSSASASSLRARLHRRPAASGHQKTGPF